MAKKIVPRTEFVAMVRFGDSKYCWAKLEIKDGQLVATEVPRQWDLSGIDLGQLANGSALGGANPTAEDVINMR